MEENFLRGETVRLTGLTREDIPTVARWTQDAGYMRLLDGRPAFPKSADDLTKQMEEGQKGENSFLFAIRPSNGEELIGYAQIDGISWSNQVAWVEIGIGDRTYWGQGYGYEAMSILLRFAFAELNLHRLQLTVFGYNERAIALYEKLGFQREGVFREFLHRDGQRYEMFLYGLLRREWEHG